MSLRTSSSATTVTLRGSSKNNPHVRLRLSLLAMDEDVQPDWDKGMLPDLFFIVLSHLDRRDVNSVALVSSEWHRRVLRHQPHRANAAKRRRLLAKEVALVSAIARTKRRCSVSCEAVGIVAFFVILGCVVTFGIACGIIFPLHVFPNAAPAMCTYDREDGKIIAVIQSRELKCYTRDQSVSRVLYSVNGGFWASRWYAPGYQCDYDRGNALAELEDAQLQVAPFPCLTVNLERIWKTNVLIEAEKQLGPERFFIVDRSSVAELNESINWAFLLVPAVLGVLCVIVSCVVCRLGPCIVKRRTAELASVREQITALSAP